MRMDYHLDPPDEIEEDDDENQDELRGVDEDREYEMARDREDDRRYGDFYDHF